MGGHAPDFALQLLALPADDPLLFLGNRGHPHGGQRMRVARHITVQPQGQFLSVALVVVDPGVPLVQTDRLHHQVLDPQLNQIPMQTVAEGAGFVATVDLFSQP